MNLQMGSQVFRNVEIPVLWGTRAIVEDRAGRLSVIDLSGNEPRLEIVGNGPAQGVDFQPTTDGFSLIQDGVALYEFYPEKKLFSPVSLKLPELELSPGHTRVGSNIFSANAVVGAAVGLKIDEQGIGMGSSLPRGLARLVVP